MFTNMAFPELLSQSTVVLVNLQLTSRSLMLRAETTYCTGLSHEDDPPPPHLVTVQCRLVDYLTTQVTGDRSMKVIEVTLQLRLGDWLVTRPTQHDVTVTVHLMHDKVDSRDVTLAVNKQQFNSNFLLYTFELFYKLAVR